MLAHSIMAEFTVNWCDNASRLSNQSPARQWSNLSICLTNHLESKIRSSDPARASDSAVGRDKARVSTNQQQAQLHKIRVRYYLITYDCDQWPVISVERAPATLDTADPRQPQSALLLHQFIVKTHIHCTYSWHVYDVIFSRKLLIYWWKQTRVGSGEIDALFLPTYPLLKWCLDFLTVHTSSHSKRPQGYACCTQTFRCNWCFRRTIKN